LIKYISWKIDIERMVKIMNFKELAAARYSLRKFSDKPIEKEVLDTVLESARLSPTAANFQPQRILVVNDENVLEKLRECTPYHFNAKTVLVVCYDKSKAWVRDEDDKNYGEVDASIVAAHIMLQAADIGLGTTFVGVFDEEPLKEKLDIPENFVPIGIIPIGYPREDARPAHFHTKRLPIEETVFYNKF